MKTVTLQPEEYSRYSRHLSLPEIGIAGQQKLKQSKVLVVGAGGLGCPALQYLVAAGVGTIGVADNDVVAESNLQRQILYNVADIGKPKAQVACEKLKLQNPYVQLIPHITYLSAVNALEIMSAYDIIVDGSDNFATRYLVNDACVLLKKPFVFGSIFRFEGQVSVFNYNEEGPTYRCLYPEVPDQDNRPNCSEAGVIGVLPGITGTLQANEVIKLITGIGRLLSGKLLSFDALNMSFQLFDFELDKSNKNIEKLESMQEICIASSFVISATELKRKQAEAHDFQLIDVRNQNEHELFNIAGELMPMHEIHSYIHRIERNKPVVIYCQKGSRSNAVVTLLRNEFGFGNVFSLTGGIEAY